MFPVNCFVILRKGIMMSMVKSRPEKLIFGMPERRNRPPKVATTT